MDGEPLARVGRRSMAKNLKPRANIDQWRLLTSPSIVAAGCQTLLPVLRPHALVARPLVTVSDNICITSFYPARSSCR